MPKRRKTSLTRRLPIGAAMAADPAIPEPTGSAPRLVRRSESTIPGPRLHPWPIRIMHWVNAVAMIVMITSGWGIYNDDVIIGGLSFGPWVRLGSWAAESLQ